MGPVLAICLLLVVNLVRGDDIGLLSAASSDFSQRLYQKIASDKSNAIYSPYSVHSVMTMTSLGAREETASEMSQALGLTTLPGKAAHQAYHDLIVQLNSVTDVKLNTANAIFVNPNIPIEAQFISDVQKDYLASASNFDLAAPEGPEKVINDYVEYNTKGMIKDILSRGSIDTTTVLVLVNTIFFNGTWEFKFDASKTKKEDFLQLAGTKSQVDMMYDERPVNIKRNVNGVDVAELPFNGGRFSLYIALPQKSDGIIDLEKSLTTPGTVDQFFEGFTRIRVKLSIPKFKIESTYSLTSALKQLGIVKAFDPTEANFQGISSVGNTYISEVVQKAVIEVKETGTVAAAVTAVIMETLSLHLPPAESFKADHPFAFFLRDNENEAIFFQGKYSG